MVTQISLSLHLSLSLLRKFRCFLIPSHLHLISELQQTICPFVRKLGRKRKIEALSINKTKISEWGRLSPELGLSKWSRFTSSVKIQKVFRFFPRKSLKKIAAIRSEANEIEKRTLLKEVVENSWRWMRHPIICC